ncbi:tRNA (guanine-N2-)-methyltransferase regulatory subunit Trm112 [Schizosaccharomyces cryophilus OY26]|uniref:tRNA (Guanine-N2-)-methyltransferase regulatory subunit Trm112 n=1 Tax=Schizosaccharomyces cryophilus (strain OY26 / ATCC MYA-4695 / CBS 11777 / NBRC 106824 / NRRL Y48691) TaxID=653667 RepID=S9X8K8_SCHCR|nr:tRNA (guanine-N2-)-methyltransferase regulatory subunit Trm112 [Schizosaccharomyces cryophilus OY26]EPY53477.1 tRNA (guanine-N2-)-methyltransferase regulatory subunit Trm112 [Schizosaccharomyces cryophilus OY26]
MKLLTVNFLTCSNKRCSGTSEAFPLKIEDAKLAIQEIELKPEFLRNILPRVDWNALLISTRQLGNHSLPEEKPELTEESDEVLLKSLHNVLLETEITEGKMTCGSCGHVYPIYEGIPNMLLSETEI